MKNVIEFLKNYKFHIAVSLIFIIGVRSCSKSSEIKHLQKIDIGHTHVTDSLNNQINFLTQKIDSFPELLRAEKLSIHIEYDNYISQQDRGKQLMDLHMIVKENITKIHTNLRTNR